MWAAHAVSEDDKLDREETKQVFRRAARLAKPQRRLALAALGFIAMSTSTTLLGPLLLRYGIDAGIRADDAGALELRDRALRRGRRDRLSRRPAAVRVRQPGR